MVGHSEQIESLRGGALAELGTAGGDLRLLESWRVRYLGRKGLLTALLRGVGELPKDDRSVVGATANRVKNEIEAAFQKQVRGARRSVGDGVDVTLSGRRARHGGLHPSTRIIRDITAIFNGLGFQTLEGPDIESERYNFDMLNFPAEHPSRDLMDTIWADIPSGGWLLRTHTSPMQARIMERQPPPIRIVSPGKCYRNEATDPAHEWHFHQVEGIAVAEGITFAHMKWTLQHFVHRMFGNKRRMRMRCDFFPFVEPGVDVSIDCFKCAGGGCRTCGLTGWIEIMGAGMVHPNVLKAANYDPAKVSGFAFGLGPERIGMLKYGIDDIRLFFENDLRFLNQF